MQKNKQKVFKGFRGRFFKKAPWLSKTKQIKSKLEQLTGRLFP